MTRKGGPLTFYELFDAKNHIRFARRLSHVLRGTRWPCDHIGLEEASQDFAQLNFQYMLWRLEKISSSAHVSLVLLRD